MPTYFKGRVPPPNLDHLRLMSFLKHEPVLKSLPVANQPTWDSRTMGWIGPVKDQKQCGCMPGTDEVLTAKGWRRWDEYDYRTPLGTMNPATGMLEFQPPLQRHVYNYAGPLHYADHQSLDFALTPNHRLYVRKWNEAKRTLNDHYEFVEASKLGWYAGLPHATTGWLGTELKELGVGDRYYSGDDFLALVALVVSDGWAGGSESTKNLVSFCCFREDRIDMVRQLAHKLGIPESPSRPGVWTLTDGALAEWMRQNVYVGVELRAPFKSVPPLVKDASQKQIEHFLRFFGDQHIQEEGTRRFYSSSRWLIDDLQELLLRIGKRGTIEERPPREAMFRGRRIESHGPDLTLTERRTELLSVGKKRNVRTDYFKGKVYCATVANGLLVTRRDKKVLVSGNSCWDFSGTFVVESAFYKAGILKPDGSQALSEEYTLSCGRNGGCNGDDNTTVLADAKAHGLPLSSAYGPYDVGSGSPSRCRWTPNMTLYKLTDWGFADSNGGQGVTKVQDIKNCVAYYGCVGCAIAADDSFMNAPAGQVFKGSGSTQIDHDVAIVGWDDNVGAWIMRNSWGPSWCEQGYIRIAYGANEVGTESVFAFVTAPAPVPPGPTPVPPVPPAPVGPTPLFHLNFKKSMSRGNNIIVSLPCDVPAGVYDVTAQAARRAVPTAEAKLHKG